eukprot:EG_transcript_5807
MSSTLAILERAFRAAAGNPTGKGSPRTPSHPSAGIGPAAPTPPRTLPRRPTSARLAHRAAAASHCGTARTPPGLWGTARAVRGGPAWGWTHPAPPPHKENSFRAKGAKGKLRRK